MTFEQAHEQFRQRFPAAPPARSPMNADELKPLAAADGVRILREAPADNEIYNPSPATKGAEGCHLWVIDDRGIPYILEYGEAAALLESRAVKHTNLTGGQPASCGGELWFASPQASKLFVNGCSGRYGPRDGPQLHEAAGVFRALGYEVVSFGWDDQAGRPAMVLP